MRKLLFLIFCLIFYFYSFSQTTSDQVSNWVKLLSSENGRSDAGINEVFEYVSKKDSAAAVLILAELEKKAGSRNNYFIARFNAVKLKWQATTKVNEHTRKNAEDWSKLAMNAAYETNNDSLIADMAWISGIVFFQLSSVEPAAMYLLFAAEMDEKTGRIFNSDRCHWLSAVLYKTREYEKAIYYTLASIRRETDTTSFNRRLTISRYNTVGVCYQRINNYDSAFYYYNIAMQMAQERRDTLWQAIISGNKGQIYFIQKNYKLARQLLEFDYNITKQFWFEQISAANTLQWIAQIDIKEGKTDSALFHVKQALSIMQSKNNYSWANYWQNIYSTAAEVYRAIGNNDSTLKYTQLYNNIRDSIERSVADSRLEISRIKLANLQNSLAIRNLQKEKKSEEQIRNLFIILIVLITVIAFFYINRLRLKHIHKENLAKQEKAAAEASAREQLELLTQKITEKANLVEELQSQLANRAHAIEKQELSEAISNLTILTESDWDKFKKLFEQLHPGFFISLQEKVSDITSAELRMAALTRLHLSTNQIASILGISPNSVYKTKQRLRNRLNLDPDASIEQVISKLV